MRLVCIFHLAMYINLTMKVRITESLALCQSESSIHSDEGLMLEMSAFRIPVRWSIYIINSVDKTKFLCSFNQFPNSTMKWYMKWIICDLQIWNQVKLWSSQLWMQFLQLCKEAWESQDFNGVWTCDLTLPVQRSNQLSYEATDVGSWSFVGSNVPVRNEFFRLLYAIAKIAFRTARIIASLDFLILLTICYNIILFLMMAEEKARLLQVTIRL